MTNEELLQLQNVQYQILVELDRICRKYQIKYYLAYGTLLGAIRHQGSIPWDYDIDTFMDAENFEKFSAHVDELSNLYEFKPVGGKWGGLSRIYKKNTLIYDPRHGREHAFPIHIDVFKLEYAKPRSGFSRRIVTAWAKYLMIAKLSDYEKGWLYERFKDNTLKKLVVRSGNAIRRFASEEEIEKWVHNMLISATEEKEFAVMQDLNYRCAVESFGWGRVHQYEQAEFPIPQNTDEILLKMYGDYMQYPPVEERFTSNMDNLIVMF